MLNKILVLLAVCVSLFAMNTKAQAETQENFTARIVSFDCANRGTSLETFIEHQLRVSEKNDIYSIETTCGNKFWDLSFNEVPRTWSIQREYDELIVVDVTFPPVYVTFNIAHYGAPDEKVQVWIPVKVSLTLTHEEIDIFLTVMRPGAGTKIRVEGTIAMPTTEAYPRSREAVLQMIDEMLNPLLPGTKINSAPM